MQQAAFMLSAFGLLVVATLASIVVSRRWDERFWIAAAAVLLQLGAISTLLSLAGRFAPGPFLGAQAILLTGAVLIWRRTPRPPAGALRPPRDWAWSAMLVLVLGFLLLSGLEQGLAPLWGIDERNYHASRACYWVQHRSILPFETHNDRQTVFPFLAELLFAWGVMFTKEEVFGRMAFWLALPAAAVGMYTVGRAANLGRRGAMAAVLVLVSTPTVLEHASGLKPDIWQPALALGTAFFVLRAAAGNAARALAMAGVMVALAVSVKTTSLALVPVVALAAIVARLDARSAVRGVSLVALGGTAGVLLGGFAVVLAHNLREFRRPLGPAELVAIVSPDRSWHQFGVHAARTPLFLFEVPEAPTEGARAGLEALGTRLAGATGADARLNMELDRGWPGHFRFQSPPVAFRYSLAGLLWLPLLGVGFVRLAREARSRWRRPRPSAVAWLIILQAPLFAGVVFMIRWMGGGPERFWLGAFALGVPVTVYFARRWARASVWAGAAASLLLAWQVYPSLRSQAVEVYIAIAAPRDAGRLDEPFQSVVPLIPPGSRVLLVAGQSANDYPLFGPRSGYRTMLWSWGQGAFNGPRLDQHLADHGITHVVVEHPRRVGFLWNRGLRTEPFAEHLRKRGDFELSTESEGTPVLFKRSAGPEATPPGS